MAIPCSREHPLCLRRPSLRLTYPSFTVESHPLGPLALNFMPVWAALALLSPFTLPWELSSGACSLPLPQRTVLLDWRVNCCPNPLAPGWRPSAERALFCLISWARERCQGQSRSLRNEDYFFPSFLPWGTAAHPELGSVRSLQKEAVLSSHVLTLVFSFS